MFVKAVRRLLLRCRWLYEVVDLAGDVAFQAADGLPAGLAFGGAPIGQGRGRGDGEDRQCRSGAHAGEPARRLRLVSPGWWPRARTGVSGSTGRVHRETGAAPVDRLAIERGHLDVRPPGRTRWRWVRDGRSTTTRRCGSGLCVTPPHPGTSIARCGAPIPRWLVTGQRLLYVLHPQHLPIFRRWSTFSRNHLFSFSQTDRLLGPSRW